MIIFLDFGLKRVGWIESFLGNKILCEVHLDLIEICLRSNQLPVLPINQWEQCTTKKKFGLISFKCHTLTPFIKNCVWFTSENL